MWRLSVPSLHALICAVRPTTLRCVPTGLAVVRLEVALLARRQVVKQKRNLVRATTGPRLAYRPRQSDETYALPVPKVRVGSRDARVATARVAAVASQA